MTCCSPRAPAASTAGACVITTPSRQVLVGGQPGGCGATAGAAAHPLGSALRPRLQGLAVERLSHGRCHTSVTNYADSPGQRCSDLPLRTRPGLTWTPEDGLYNLCQVVPSEGARISTGASSGPSKRYCRGAAVVSLTRLTLSHLTFSHGVGWERCAVPPTLWRWREDPRHSLHMPFSGVRHRTEASRAARDLPEIPLLRPVGAVSSGGSHRDHTAHRSGAHSSSEAPRPVRAPTGSGSGVPRGHQSSWPGSDS